LPVTAPFRGERSSAATIQVTACSSSSASPSTQITYAASVTPAGERNPKELLTECQKINQG